MMRIVLYIFLLMLLHAGVCAQVTDPETTRSRQDTVPPSPKQDFPVLSDTTQYIDTVVSKLPSGNDTTVKKRVHSPRAATIRSLIIPGWGQVYNKKYWKVPIVYAAIGIPAYLFFDNRAWYNRIRYALEVIVDTNLYNNAEARAKVHPRLKTFVDGKLEGGLVNYRNDYRKDMDYSILFTILMWGLNIVDATVDAHLKDFNVSDDLSLKLKPSFNNGTMTPGLSLVLNFK